MEKQAENTTSPVLKSETGEVYDIPEGGSLGLLALGYAGVMLWRGKRAAVNNLRHAEKKSGCNFEVAT